MLFNFGSLENQSSTSGAWHTVFHTLCYATLLYMAHFSKYKPVMWNFQIIWWLCTVYILQCIFVIVFVNNKYSILIDKDRLWTKPMTAWGLQRHILSLHSHSKVLCKLLRSQHSPVMLNCVALSSCSKWSSSLSPPPRTEEEEKAGGGSAVRGKRGLHTVLRK